MRQVPLSCLEWGCDHQCLLFKAWGGALLKHTSLSQDGKPGHGTGQILFCSFTRREWELRGCVYCILDDSCILGLICPHHHHDHPGRKPSCTVDRALDPQPSIKTSIWDGVEVVRLLCFLPKTAEGVK